MVKVHQLQWTCPIQCFVVVPGGLGADVREPTAARYTIKEVTLDCFNVKILSV